MVLPYYVNVCLYALIRWYTLWERYEYVYVPQRSTYVDVRFVFAMANFCFCRFQNCSAKRKYMFDTLE